MIPVPNFSTARVQTWRVLDVIPDYLVRSSSPGAILRINIDGIPFALPPDSRPAKGAGNYLTNHFFLERCSVCQSDYLPTAYSNDHFPDVCPLCIWTAIESHSSLPTSDFDEEAVMALLQMSLASFDRAIFAADRFHSGSGELLRSLAADQGDPQTALDQAFLFPKKSWFMRIQRHPQDWLASQLQEKTTVLPCNEYEVNNALVPACEFLCEKGIEHQHFVSFDSFSEELLRGLGGHADLVIGEKLFVIRGQQPYFERFLKLSQGKLLDVVLLTPTDLKRIGNFL